jgi:DNA-binding HxlR family transcriptional regulator
VAKSSAARKRQSEIRNQKSESSSRKRSPLELDRLIHERLRLGIVSALAVNDRLTFNDLKYQLRTTDGNLSVHARKLEDAQYIVVEKSFEGRMPHTEYRLTPAGRRALEKYLAHMEAIIKAAKN